MEKKRYCNLSEILSKTKEKETVSSSFHEASMSFIQEPDKDVPTEKKNPNNKQQQKNDRPVFLMNIDSRLQRKNS